MITETQRIERRKHIGASDVAALFGLSPFGNQSDVYWSKVEGIDVAETEAMRVGSLHESAVLTWAEMVLETPLVRDMRLVHEGGILAANMDGIIPEGRVPVEAKTAGMRAAGPWLKEWGEPGTDEVPRHVLLQVQAQMACSGADSAYVPALIFGRGHVMYRVGRSERLVAAILKRVDEFWTEHVEKRVPPPEAPSLETVKAIARDPEAEAVNLPDDLVRRVMAIRAAEKRLKEMKAEAEAGLLYALGDSEAGLWSGGKVSYREQTRKAYTVAESSYRVLRISGKVDDLPKIDVDSVPALSMVGE